MTKRFKSAGPTIFQNFAFILVVFLTRLSATLSKKVITTAEILEFQLWVKDNFPKAKFFIRRESAWKKICQITNNGEIRIIELGVAWGYSTNWFLTKGFPATSTGIQLQIKIDAFDLFTGMPKKWRNHNEGAFSNGGEFPNVVDQRLTFHKGLIEETIQVLNQEELRKSKKIILFDLDLYEPTLFAYKFLKDTIISGDILYFDEAFDSDEKEVIKGELLRDYEVEVVAYTPLAAAFVIIGEKGHLDD